MAFTYCPSCGYKNLYGVNPTKFCGGCGEALHGDVAAAKPKPNLSRTTVEAKRFPTRQSTEDEEGTDIYQVPNINQLKYTISEGDMGASKTNLRDLAGEITEDQIEAVQNVERGDEKKKRGRPKGSKNSTHGKRRTKRK